MISSLWFFSPRKPIYGVGVGVGGPPGGPRGRGRAPHPRGQGVGPLVFIFCEDFSLFFLRCSVEFQDIPRIFIFCTKNNTMAVLLKIASVWVSSIQIIQVRVQNKGKSVWKSRYDGDVSLSSGQHPTRRPSSPNTLTQRVALPSYLKWRVHRLPRPRARANIC